MTAELKSGSEALPPPRTLLGDAWRRLKRNRLAVIGAMLLLLIVCACFIEDLTFGLVSLDEETQNYGRALESPSSDHVFGTDSLGRSYLARVLKGGRTSLLVGLVATLASMLIGVTYGCISGYYGGRLDEIMMRVVDFLYGIPYMFLVILIMLMFERVDRGNPLPVFLALGLVQWLTMSRIVRGQVLSLRNQQFVEAARALGAGDGRIMFRHILPNILGVVIVYATLTVPAVIILESFLSYLGLGLKLSWGWLASEAMEVVGSETSYWWLILFPSLFLAGTLLSLNFLGDGLRDALDPKGER